MLKKLQSKKGFTLMEMLIVVAIIAVLVAIAIEWQTSMLTENTKAPTSNDAFLAGPDNGTAIVLNYPKKLTVSNDGTITYTASKLTDAANAESKTFTWKLGTPEIN